MGTNYYVARATELEEADRVYENAPDDVDLPFPLEGVGLRIGVSSAARTAGWIFRSYEVVTYRAIAFGATGALNSFPVWKKFLHALPDGVAIYRENHDQISASEFLELIVKPRQSPIDPEQSPWPHYYLGHYTDAWGYAFDRDDFS